LSHTCDVLVRRRAGEGVCPMEVRVAVIGNVDSGKSTLVGVLTRSMLDDGRGLARGKVRGGEGGRGRHCRRVCVGGGGGGGVQVLCTACIQVSEETLCLGGGCTWVVCLRVTRRGCRPSA